MPTEQEMILSTLATAEVPPDAQAQVLGTAAVSTDLATVSAANDDTETGT